MADKSKKWALNEQGPYYVDDQCIACDACVYEAPDFFKMNDIKGHAYVYKQPTNPKDFELCQLALEHCPVEAIGDDA